MLLLRRGGGCGPLLLRFFALGGRGRVLLRGHYFTAPKTVSLCQTFSLEGPSGYFKIKLCLIRDDLGVDVNRRNWVFEKFDHILERVAGMRLPPRSAAVLR
ncbi:MAG: hypothetical protein K9G71_14215 [Rhodobacteraceae bacterium]|nr:hypothetical protein [Paracoccaceae bacterium]MCF8515393.1 hypothetical protein [Paracoccaceae bacterium]MCF8519638.1 hypothetical protein [Paracoccaceae bacterium]